MGAYHIYLEGYRATGEEGYAQYFGCYPGDSFREAIENMMQDKDWDTKNYYDPIRLTYWGCQFYDNEEDARKSFN